MVHSGMTQHERALPTDGWWEDNDRGLALSADAEWSEAAEAFAAAADALARRLPADATAHDPLAMVLGNLSQALFRAGRLDDAIQQAQRACALRVALAGEDGMPVARARTDLAVMLAAAGRGDEAMALVQRAIAGIEHRVGDEDARLATVLENGARIALATGHPANAEPLLLRLHALLDAHELSTARADTLLARVAAVRAKQAQEAALTRPVELAADAPTPTPTMTPVSAVLAEVTRTVAEREALEQAQDEDVDALLVPPVSATTPAPSPAPLPPVYVHSSIAADDDWEDQPLRDAVVLTDVLLRTTPSGVPAIPEPVSQLDTVEIIDAVEITDSIEMVEMIETVETAEMADTVDIELDIVDTAEMTAAPTSASATPANEPPSMLGFTVQHGIVDDPTFDLVEPTPVVEPVDVVESVNVIEPVDIIDAVVAPVEAVVPAPVKDTAPSTPPRQSPRSVAVVLPTPDKGQQAISTEASAPVRGTARKSARSNNSKRADATPRGEVPSSGGAMRWVAAGGAALAAAGGAVWWFLLR
jgi:tetratricopeptide (TPR) repeat protein